MTLTPEDVSREVASTGFGGDALEKVFRLMALLDALGSHPFLKTRIALKGGTALNLFYSDVLRLSVDVDLNYIGTAERETMLAERTKLERAVHAACAREGFRVRRMPSEHAGGKWRLTYVASNGGPGSLELDVNFMLRTPLWPPRIAECHPVGSFKAAPITVLDPHELAAELRERLAVVLPLRAHEREFLERLNGAGDIAPEILTSDAAMQGVIRNHPGLKWKALNVRRRLGLTADDDEAAGSHDRRD